MTENYISAVQPSYAVQKAPVLASGLIVALIVSTFTLTGPAYSQTAKGPYIDQARFIYRPDGNLALEEIKNGNLDAYYFNIPLESADDAKDDPRLHLYDRTAGSMGLLVNPAPSSDGKTLNPFSSRETRYALNYLVDRQFMVDEVLKGYGSPMIDPFGIYSPEYLNVIDIVQSFGFRYNPSLADSMISGAMTEAGATKSNGKWMYNGAPVTVKIMIRQDDAPRKSMGEVVASELEKIGFTVQKDYGDLTKANSVVYGSNPQELQWNIYTEGFAGTSVFVKYNPIVPAQMYAPWYGSLPGSQNSAYWTYKNSTLDAITQKIAFFNFTSEAERNDLVRKAVQQGVQESVRIFIAQKTDPFVASSTIQGLVNDFGAGITSKYSLLNARPGNGSNSLDIGVKQIYQGSWNDVAGLQDTYSRDIYHNVADSGTFRDPYTGEIIPMRAVWTDISTKGPTDRLDVAPDAQLWDPATQQWKNVGEGTRSLSKVTFTPLYSKWHNGIPMDKSDMMYSEYFTFEWGTDSGKGDQTVDPEFTSQAQVALPLLKGFKFSQNGIEAYVDLWHYDEKEIADSAIFWPTEPWEITAATERIVTAGKLAYSRSQASAEGVQWLDPLVPEHADMIKAELQKMKSENFVPASLKDVVSPADAAKRYDASIKWIEDHNHAVISNGAFYLDSFNKAGGTITIKAFRDDSYPFEQGHWAKYQTPKLADISKVDVAKSVAIGQPVQMTMNVNVAGNPSNNATVYYFISDKDGRSILKGEAKPEGNVGEFRIALQANDTSKLSPGPNQLSIFAYSTEALRPDIATGTILAAMTGNNNAFTISSTLGGNSYSISGQSTANVKATSFAINPEQSVTVTFDKAGEVELTLPKTMIDGINGVTAGSQTVNFTPTKNADSTTIKFTVPEGATTVEIKGATVAPEFSVIAVAVLGISIAAIIGYTRFARSGRY
jgi:peptide/nickel transport system substrate-binding protein